MRAAALVQQPFALFLYRKEKASQKEKTFYGVTHPMPAPLLKKWTKQSHKEVCEHIIINIFGDW